MPLLASTTQADLSSRHAASSKAAIAADATSHMANANPHHSDNSGEQGNRISANSNDYDFWSVAAMPWQRIRSLHSRYHRNKVKWALQAVAIALALILVIWPQLTYSSATDGQLQGVDPRVDRMREAKLRGIDRSGRHFTIAAAEVKKLDSLGQSLGLSNIQSELRLANNGRMQLIASQGDVNQATSQLNLNNGVEITRQDGFRMDLGDLRYNWLNGEGISQQPVSGKGPNHQLQAEGLKIEQHGNKLTFLGHTILHL